MRRATIGILALLCASAASLGSARAQDASGDASSEAVLPPARLSYDEYRLNELEFLAGRSRIALISTSVAAAVGGALVAPALVTECVRITSSSSFDDIRCSTAGKALLGIGIPILVAGALGVIISGTMFGVRRGKIRNIENRIAYEKSSAIRWDPSRAVFEF
jgi:uncharacterized integral membrane protein